MHIHHISAGGRQVAGVAVAGKGRLHSTCLLVQRTQMTLLRAAVDFTALFGDNIHHRKPRFDDEFLQTLAPPCGLIAAAGHTDKDLAPLLPFVAVSPA